jgi:hypothetical protein
LLSRDRNLFCVLIGNDYDKMLHLPNICLFIFSSCAPVYIFDQLVVAFFFIIQINIKLKEDDNKQLKDP